MPEVVWKAYIDFEYEEEEWDRTRALYRRLLERTSHVKVWISWAQFENNAGKTIARAYRDQDDEEEEDEADGEARAQEKIVSPEAEEAAQQAEKDALAAARKVFEDGYKDLKQRGLKQERLILLEAWKALEQADGDNESLAKVEAMMPRVVKKRRAINGDGSQQEEYFDMMFPVSPTTALWNEQILTGLRLRTTRPPHQGHQNCLPWHINGRQSVLLRRLVPTALHRSGPLGSYVVDACCKCSLYNDRYGLQVTCACRNPVPRSAAIEIPDRN